MRTGFSALLTTILVASPGLVWAEADAREIPGRAAMEASFEATAPPLGAPAPDVQLVNAKGNVFNLRDLVGENYTVLVLGCLT